VFPEQAATVAGSTSPEPPGSGLVPSQKISDYLRALRRRWWVVAWTAVVAGAAGFALSASMPKEYDGAAKLMLDNAQPVDVVRGTAPTRSLDPERDINTSVALVKTETVARRVKSDLASRFDLGSKLTILQLLRQVSVATQGSSNIVVVTARDRVPEQAAAIANAFAAEYVAFRRNSARAPYSQAAQEAESKLQSLPPTERNGPQGRALDENLRQLQIAATLQTGGVQLVDRAAVPTTASTPRPKFSTAVAAIIGLLIGSILAVFQEFTDRRLKDEADVEGLVALPVLAKVPYGKRSLVPGSYDRRVQMEAYATLAVSLRLLALGADLRTIMLTSANQDDGKTSVTLGVGRALASTGQRVIAIEADLRRPKFAEYLELRSLGGLAKVIVGQSSLSDELVEVDLRTGAPLRERELPHEGSFAVLPAGRVGLDPHRLLSSQHMREILTDARNLADVVLIDTPAMESVSDALSLGALVDTTVFVARLKHSTKEGTRRSLRALAKVGIDVAGIVLTGVSSSQQPYGYLSDEQSEGDRKRTRSRLSLRR
jgi:tyrosine-protein kinase